MRGSVSHSFIPLPSNRCYYKTQSGLEKCTKDFKVGKEKDFDYVYFEKKSTN